MVFTKTAKGRAEVTERRAGLNGKQRSVLIICDLPHHTAQQVPLRHRVLLLRTERTDDLSCQLTSKPLISSKLTVGWAGEKPGQQAILRHKRKAAAVR